MRRTRVSLIHVTFFILSISITVFSGALLLVSNKQDSQYSMIFNVFLIAIPFAVSELIAILVQKFEKLEKPPCSYQEYLEEIGLRRIYEERDMNYINDILYDLEHLDSRHTRKNKPVPIMMIGVALIYYFDEDCNRRAAPIASEIRKLSTSCEFQALVSHQDSEELRRRDEMTQKMGLTYMYGESSQPDILKDIEKSIEIVKKWKEETTDKSVKILFRKYKQAPYATIIYINNHIYYSPNMPYEKRKTRSTDRDQKNPNPTFCILRDSLYGKKLENMYTEMWKGAEKVNIEMRVKTGEEQTVIN